MQGTNRTHRRRLKSCTVAAKFSSGGSHCFRDTEAAPRIIVIRLVYRWMVEFDKFYQTEMANLSTKHTQSAGIYSYPNGGIILL